jgi:hypothetical protein
VAQTRRNVETPTPPYRTVRSWAIRQIVAGGVILGRLHRHSPELTASSAKTALAAHNSSARSGCARYGNTVGMAGAQSVFGGHSPPITLIDVIRHVTTPATNSATAISDASTGTSHERLTIGARPSRPALLLAQHGERACRSPKPAPTGRPESEA